MNGAELPCGTVIKVEPARTNDRKDGDHYGPAAVPNAATNEESTRAEASTAEEATTEADEKKVEEASEELDDFFASL